MIRRLRALWRRMRTIPLVGRLAERVDRAHWTRVIRRADIVDLAFVRAQRGRAVSARRAVRDYVRGGFRTGSSLHPLFFEPLVSRQLSDAERVPALYAYLVNDPSAVRTSVAWDAPAALAAAGSPPTARGALGALGPGVDPSVALRAGGSVTLLPWSRVRTAAIEAASPEDGGVAPHDAGESLLFLCRIAADEAEPDTALRLVDEVLASEPDARAVIEVVAARPDVAVQARLLALADARIAVLRSPADEASFAGRARIIVTRAPHARISARDVLALAAEAVSGPVAPLWLDAGGVVVSAGVVMDGGAPVHLLAGHPSEDARRLGETVPVADVAGGTHARTVDVTTAGPRTLLSATVVAPAAPPPRTLPRGGDVGPPHPLLSTRAPGRLRWALKTSAPAGAAGEAWGDTHFARGIAEALRRAEQEVVVDAYGARRRPLSEHLDDVTLVLRGPRRIVPPKNGVRVLWVISHPDEITEDELRDFDLVFAASTAWADRMTAQTGLPVLPLLQCTDPGRFRPQGVPRTDEIVFVGTARGIRRPSVVVPLAAGLPVRVYGPDWRGFIPASAIAATGIDNRELPARYESAAVVLNDHWPAMRSAGFISNRLYDVVAAGGRAVSDDVSGIAEEFGGAVQVFHGEKDLVDLLSGDLDAAFPPPAELARLSELVRRRDSFDARAVELLSRVSAAVSRAVAGS